MTKPKWILWICALLGGGCSLLQLCFVGPTNDTDAAMHYAWDAARGMVNYRLWLESNPPLFMFLDAPAAMLAVWLHLPAATVLYGYYLLLSLGSLLLTRWALRQQRCDDSTQILWLCAAVTVLAIIPYYCAVYGDRDHLFFILALPWIIQMLLRLPPIPLTAPIAAVGFLLRPQNLLLFAALQMLGGPASWNIRQRLLAPSSRIMAVSLVLYALLIATFFPDYITHALPINLIAYQHFDMQIKMLQSVLPLSLIALLLIEDVRSRGLYIWLGFIALSLIAYTLCGGWLYTLYFLLAPLSLLIFWRLAVHKESQYPRAILVLIILSIMSTQKLCADVESSLETGSAQNYHHIPPELHQKLMQEAAPEFILISTTMWGVNFDVLGSTPHALLGYTALTPLGWLYYHPQHEYAAFVRNKIDDALLAVIKAHPNAPLIVDDSPEKIWLPDYVDLLPMLRQNKSIDEKLAYYNAVRVIDSCTKDFAIACKYTVWRRR